jgi:hypothetical protein
MSIALTGTTTLENASIQYTYPEMDIRGIDKAKDIIKFKFRNGLSSSSFSFTDVDGSIFKSGIASEGIISKKKHTYIDNDLNITYELTVKHITSMADDFFYVVFPITSSEETSFLNSIAEKGDTSINIINMDSVVNKSLNSIIGDEYSSDVYKYTNKLNKMVFVFKTPITTVISNYSTNVKAEHTEWTGVADNNKIINLIPSGSGGKVSEEIVCDSTGNTITEPVINNKNLSNTFSRVGSITIFFAVFALYTAFFYKYLPTIQNGVTTSTEYGIIGLYVLFFAGITTLAFTLPNSYKNINFLNIDVFKSTSFYALLFIPLWDAVYKLMALFLYSNVYEFPNSVYEFIFSYFKSNFEEGSNIKKYILFLLGLLLIIWVLFVCVILVK